MLTAKSIGTGGLGRMGNQMFTIAGVIGIAIKSGQPWGFPRWVTHDNKLFGQEPDDIQSHLVNDLPSSDGLTFQDYGYFWGYRDIVLPNGNWSIDAHMQSYQFFSHCIDTIREVFRFKDEPPQNDYVAIHYRAGDYIDDATAQHPRCGWDYYEKAMNLFPEETKFILFSDNRNDWIKQTRFSRFVDVVWNYPKQSYIEDFKLMKRCKHFICANSSYSTMAAILGEHPDKKIYMPSRWFGSSMPPEFTTTDIYPEGAIVI